MVYSTYWLTTFDDGMDRIWLWTYNHVKDTGHDTGVIIDLGFFDAPKFIVTVNRLFLAAWVDIFSEIATDVHDN